MQLEDQKADKFEAEIEINTSSDVTYHAYLTTKAGQAFLLSNALTVAVTYDLNNVTEGLNKEQPLQLGALVPNTCAANMEQEAFLVVFRGDPSTFSITDAQDKPQDWSIEEEEEKDVILSRDGPLQRSDVASMYKIDPPQQIVTLKLTIPNVAPKGGQRVFWLNAKDGPGTEDKLAFIVAAG